jgi:hypothetical protein
MVESNNRNALEHVPSCSSWPPSWLVPSIPLVVESVDSPTSSTLVPADPEEQAAESNGNDDGVSDEAGVIW